MNFSIINRDIQIGNTTAIRSIVSNYKPEIDLVLPDANISDLNANLQGITYSIDNVLDSSAAASAGFSFGSSSISHKKFMALMQWGKLVSVEQIYKNNIMVHERIIQGEPSNQLPRLNQNSPASNSTAESESPDDVFTILYTYGVGYRVEIAVEQLDAKADVKIASIAANATAGKLATQTNTVVFGFRNDTPNPDFRDVPSVLLQNKPFDSAAQGALSLWREKFQSGISKLPAGTLLAPQLMRVSFNGKITRDLSGLKDSLPLNTYIMRRLKHGDTLEKSIRFLEKSSSGGQRDFNYFGKDIFSREKITSAYKNIFLAFNIEIKSDDDLEKMEVPNSIKTYAKESIDRFEHMGN